MKKKNIIKIIEEANISSQEKAELINKIKKESDQDTILIIIRALGISIDIISWFISVH